MRGAVARPRADVDRRDRCSSPLRTSARCLRGIASSCASSSAASGATKPHWLSVRTRPAVAAAAARRAARPSGTTAARRSSSAARHSAHGGRLARRPACRRRPRSRSRPAAGRTAANGPRSAAASRRSPRPSRRPDRARAGRCRARPRAARPGGGTALPPDARRRSASIRAASSGSAQSASADAFARQGERRVHAAPRVSARRAPPRGARARPSGPTRTRAISWRSLARHRVEIGVVPQPRLERRAGDARLAGIDLPGMEIEDRRALVAPVDLADRPAREARRAAGGRSRRRPPRAAGRRTSRW